MSLAVMDTESVGVLAVDQASVLQALNLNPRDPKTQALLLVCQKYDLDPLMKHMVLISGNPYITRDGYLHVAHASGQFDGMEVIDQGETQSEWWARVSVYRKDMRHPFTYTGRYPKADAKHMAKYGPEMAMKCAEVMALRRAFDVSGVGAAEEQHTETPYLVPPAAAKRQLLEAVGGDRDRALELWGDRGSEPIPEVELDELLDLAEASASDAPGVADGSDPEPAADPLADAGAGAVASDPAPESAKPKYKALTLLQTLCSKDPDLKDRDARLAWAAGILGHDVATFSDLEPTEVSKLIKQIEEESVA